MFLGKFDIHNDINELLIVKSFKSTLKQWLREKKMAKKVRVREGETDNEIRQVREKKNIIFEKDICTLNVTSNSYHTSRRPWI